jgi:hypothetical protein
MVVMVVVLLQTLGNEGKVVMVVVLLQTLGNEGKGSLSSLLVIFFVMKTSARKGSNFSPPMALIIRYSDDVIKSV